MTKDWSTIDQLTASLNFKPSISRSDDDSEGLRAKYWGGVDRKERKNKESKKERKEKERKEERKEKKKERKNEKVKGEK